MVSSHARATTGLKRKNFRQSQDLNATSSISRKACLSWCLIQVCFRKTIVILVVGSVSFAALSLWSFGGIRTNDSFAYPSEQLLSPNAYPVYGMTLEFQLRESSKFGGELAAISAVYAIPTDEGSSKASSSLHSNVKGIVLLLHACTHNAYKFFSYSRQCPNCVGLSEEMQIVRLVLERGYAAIAVSSFDDRSGCWGDQRDIERIHFALKEFMRRTQSELVDRRDRDRPVIYAIGASSGGAMAGKLLASGVVDAALVMVMGLSTNVLDKLLSQEAPIASKSLYLAPMTKDQHTATRSRENYAYLKQRIPLKKSMQSLWVSLNETACQPLPLTPDYLWNRVSGMTLEAARIVVNELLAAGHLDQSTHLMKIDPTRSDWRSLLLAKNEDIPKSLIQYRRDTYQDVGDLSAENNMILWDTFDLTRGKSPLAKALHRAWAFHEYCSEAVIPALNFFEQHQH